MKRNCLWCDSEFEVTRSDKTTCGVVCSRRLASKKVRLKGKRKDKLATHRTCSYCHEEKLIKDFKTWTTCNDCYKIQRVSIKKDVETFNDVEAYVLRVKENNFIVEMADIFILVDLYDRVFPTTLSVPFYNVKSGNNERSYLYMFEKVAKWYRQNK